MFAIPIVVSAAVVGGLYSLYRTKQNEAQQNAAIQKGYHTIQIYYPDCHQKIIGIYDAAGLIPLIIKRLESTDDGEELATINKVIQEILSPEGLKLNDVTYLDLIHVRLKQAYTQANLPATPVIDIPKLKVFFSNPIVWETLMPDLEVDATKIIQVRTNLNTYIQTYPQFTDPAFILKCLDGIAKELNEITQTFQGKSLNVTLETSPIYRTTLERKKLTGT